MAIYRNIQMTFWTDPKIIDEFTPEDKYFYLYLFTNPHTNLCGCYEISKRHAVLETGYSKETIDKLLDRFEKKHKVICYCADTKEVLLINWSHYNWTSSDKFRKPLAKEIERVKNTDFRRFLTDLYNGIDTVSIPYGIGIDTTVTDTVINTVNNIEDINIVNKVNNNTNNNTLYNKRFQEFWEIYPVKKDKKRAYKCYLARLNEGYSEEELLKAAENYVKECKKEKRETKYIKHATTFLSVNTPFEDYIKGDEDNAKQHNTTEFTEEELRERGFWDDFV